MAYDINSIQSLTFREGVRQRVSMYLGTDDIEGAYQAIKEILNNSTDEALAGYGKQIDITLNYDDNRIAIRDFGRGVPFGIKPDGENVLVSVYTKSHTGGKFDKNSYKNSSGLNGIGGSCVCLSSKFFKVISVRDGIAAEASFIEGNLQNYKESKTKDKNGTYVEFIPDEKVFSNGEIQYDYDRICRDVKDISYLYSGITFNVDCYYEEEKIRNTYCAKNAILLLFSYFIPGILILMMAQLLQWIIWITKRNLIPFCAIMLLKIQILLPMNMISIHAMNGIFFPMMLNVLD